MDLNFTEVWIDPRDKTISVYGPNSIYMMETLPDRGTKLCVADGRGEYKVLAPRI